MRVPVYDSPQVNEAPLPQARQNNSVDTGLGDVASGLQRLGSGLDAAYREAKQRADVVQNADALSDAQERIDRVLTDPKTGILTAQGREAFDRADGYQQRILDAQNQAAASLQSDEQKAMYARMSRRFVQTAMQRVEMHLGEEQNRIQQDSLANTAKSGLDAVGAAQDDPLGVAIEHRARYEGQLNAINRDPDYVNAKLQEWDQNAALTILRPLLSKQDPNPADAQRAQKLFDSPYAPGPDGKMMTLGEALGGARSQVAPALAQMRQQGVDQTNAQRLVAFATDPNTGLLNEDRLAQGFQATPKEALTRGFLEAFGRQREVARQLDGARRSSVFSTALSQFLQGGHSLSAVDPSTQTWLTHNDPEGALRLENIADQWKHREDGVEKIPNPQQSAAYVALHMDLAQNPDKYAAMGPADYAREWAPQLTEKDWREGGLAISQIQAAANKPDKSLSLPTMAQKSVTEMFQRAFDEPVPNSDKWDEGKQKLFRNVLEYVTDQERDYKRAHRGEQPPLEQYEKWAGGRLQKVVVPGTGFNVFGHRFLATETPRVDAELNYDVPPQAAPAAPATASAPAARAPTTLGDVAPPSAPGPGDSGLHVPTASTSGGEVPAAERDLIVKAYAKAKKPAPSEEQIRAMYAKRKGGK